MILGLGAGADDYLTKPFRIAELRARVKRSFAKREKEKHTCGASS